MVQEIAWQMIKYKHYTSTIIKRMETLLIEFSNSNEMFLINSQGTPGPQETVEQVSGEILLSAIIETISVEHNKNGIKLIKAHVFM